MTFDVFSMASDTSSIFCNADPTFLPPLSLSQQAPDHLPPLQTFGSSSTMSKTTRGLSPTHLIQSVSGGLCPTPSSLLKRVYLGLSQTKVSSFNSNSEERATPLQWVAYLCQIRSRRLASLLLTTHLPSPGFEIMFEKLGVSYTRRHPRRSETDLL